MMERTSHFTLAGESRNPLLKPAQWACASLDQSHSTTSAKIHGSVASKRRPVELQAPVFYSQPLGLRCAGSRIESQLSLQAFVLLSLLALFFTSVVLAQEPDLEEQVRAIASGLRCVVCQNLSVADSPSELAQQMKALVREQLQEGKSPEEIKAYFVSKYGEWVLLAPQPKGFSLLVWVLPFVALAAGIILAFMFTRRWVRRKRHPKPLGGETEGEDHPMLLRQEEARLRAELEELDFDCQAGRLSDADYTELRRDLEAQSARIAKQLGSFDSAAIAAQAKRSEANRAVKEGSADGGQLRSMGRRPWRLAAAGLFLLLFGVALGAFLTRSLRPRTSDQDSITGGFLTGTGGGVGSLLAQGRAAFDRNELNQAVEAFKKALTIDPGQPEAHAYMGMILAQVGHADGALMAFDRSLSSDPNFPLALWGKGMVLYQAKQDYSGAQETLQKLLSLMPPGEERNGVQKTIAEIAQHSKAAPPRKVQAFKREGAEIRGTIAVDPKLKAKVDSKAVLFIIVRPANASAGPPLAVKKIERPVFPLNYTLGPESVMMPGTPLSGKVNIAARLDQDGDPMTRESGNLMGEYKKNPVEVGSQKIDIVIDHEM